MRIKNDAQGMDIKIARPALTYGSGLTFTSGRVISDFMKKAYAAKLIDMKDDGRDLRAYCYIGDALNQLMHILLLGKDAIVAAAPSRVCLDMKKTLGEFDIKPRINMDAGLRRMIDWNLALIAGEKLSIDRSGNPCK